MNEEMRLSAHIADMAAEVEDPRMVFRLRADLGSAISRRDFFVGEGLPTLSRGFGFRVDSKVRAAAKAARKARAINRRRK